MEIARPARVAGVRPPPTSPRWDRGRLRFADAGTLALVSGDWVIVEDPGGPWVGEVVVAPEQVVEAQPLGPLARVLRPAEAAECPAARTEGIGLDLLRSLGLPDWAARPGAPPPALRESALPVPPESARPAPPAEQD